MEKQKGFVVLSSLFIVAIWLTFIVGWIINLVEVVQMAVANSPVTTLFVLKGVGILVAPLGAICGLFF